MVKSLSNPISFRKKNPLTIRLLFNILLFSSLITLLATVFQLYLDFEKDVEKVNVQMTQIGLSYIQSISYSVWNMEQQQVEFLLEGISKLPGIAYIEVTNKGEIVAKKGKEIEERSLSHEFPLLYVLDGNKIDIGKLKVVASLEYIYQRLNERVFIIIQSQFIKTFIVSAFILFMIHYLITRHLSTMAEFARELDFFSLDKELVLKRKNKIEKNDELDQVVIAINTMIGSLQKSAKDIEKRARIEGELNAAAIVQESFSPPPPTTLKEFELAAMLHPAREMSGDFYDFVKVDDNRTALVVGDVSGKGVSASMYANIARVLLRDKSKHIKDPIELLCSLNKSLKREFQSNNFLTMSFVLLDTQDNTISYISAGHEPIVLVKAVENNYTLLKEHGYPFSEMHADLFDERIEMGVYKMEKGDVLLCYTDGLTDIENDKGEMLGEKGLYELTLKLRSKSANFIQKMIFQELIAFKGDAEQADDITMIVLKKV
ncbi:MAG: SpoIIE family protein phosphatase [Desulfobacterales bacterium]|nr:SpoIIE family protein phosphatase [Desulfobacterales bacterium]